MDIIYRLRPNRLFCFRQTWTTLALENRSDCFSHIKYISLGLHTHTRTQHSKRRRLFLLHDERFSLAPAKLLPNHPSHTDWRSMRKMCHSCTDFCQLKECKTIAETRKNYRAPVIRCYFRFLCVSQFLATPRRHSSTSLYFGNVSQATFCKCVCECGRELLRVQFH